TNQPPAPATAPINAPGKPAAAPATASASTRKDATVNYEVDKTIQYVQQGGGGLKRLSVAVVVNYRKVPGKGGKVSQKPLSAAELAQITNLVKEAMGYNQARGDTLNVVNSPFAAPEVEVIPEPPIWKQPETVDTAKIVGKYLLMGIALLLLYLRVLKPLLKKLSDPLATPPAAGASDEPGQPQLAAAGEEMLALPPGQRSYQDNLARAQQLAKEDPRVVANIVKTWVSGNE
ncbi:MAG: flagellar basal body M-ring protein FliF, partial [Thiobacillus sp.]|nr:flagellar basal body M-ring protein FliF [Thiobacillus sp.]